MVEINMKNVICNMVGINEFIQKELLKALSYVEGGFGVKPTTKVLFNTKNNTTYTGLIPHVLRVLKRFNIPYKINDLREIPEKNANFTINKDFSPRDYQTNILERASSRDILQAATGAGKTFIMACLIAKHNVKPVAVIAPSVSLAIQIKDEFAKFLNTDIGICGGGKKIIKDITVSTPESAPDELLESCKMILWDEFHVAAARITWMTGVKSINAYYRYGMSATPWRDDGKDILLEAITNVRKPHLSITASKLIEKQKLTPCTIQFIPVNKIYNWTGSYNSFYMDSIVNNEYRNNIIVNKAIEMYNNKKTILILIKNIKHGSIIQQELLKNDCLKGKVEFLYGSTDLDERANILNKVKQGEIKILIASTLADQGLDLPILDCLILAGGGRSSTRAFQRVGRVIRLYENKTNALVFDFKDMSPTLYNHYLFRRKLYETEKLWKIVD